MPDETDDRIDPDRIDDATSAAEPVAEGIDGTTSGNPIAGVEISEDEVAEAVEPDDNALEVDGPQNKHA